MTKGKGSPVLLAKQLDKRRSGQRAQRRREQKLELMKTKLEAKGYTFGETK